MVEAASLPFHRILVIADIRTLAAPARAVELRCFRAVHEGLHACVVGAVGLDEVDEVELVRFAAYRVLHPKVVPLGAIARVVVVLQDQIVLVLSNFHSPSKIAGLEATFENQGAVAGLLGDVVGLKVIVPAINDIASRVVVLAELGRGRGGAIWVFLGVELVVYGREVNSLGFVDVELHHVFVIW